MNCTGLTEITFNCPVVGNPEGSTGDYWIPGGSCTSLNTINFGPNVTTLGNYVFFSLPSSIESITIPSTLTTIGKYAFYNCTALTSVIFEEVDGWTVNGSSIDSTVLADPSTAANQLKSSGNVWTRN